MCLALPISIPYNSTPRNVLFPSLILTNMDMLSYINTLPCMTNTVIVTTATKLVRLVLHNYQFFFHITILEITNINPFSLTTVNYSGLSSLCQQIFSSSIFLFFYDSFNTILLLFSSLHWSYINWCWNPVSYYMNCLVSTQLLVLKLYLILGWWKHLS